MRIKLKNGYTVSFNLEKGVSIKDAIREAKLAAHTVRRTTKDFELTKEFDKNFGFRITELSKAIKEGNDTKAALEIKYLMRDLAADAKESHKNYVSMRKPEQLDEIINTYEKAIKVLKSDIEYEEIAEEAEKLLETIKENWGKVAAPVVPTVDSKKVKDRTTAWEDEDCLWVVMLASINGEELYLTRNNHFSPNVNMALAFSEEDARNKVIELSKNVNPERFDFVCALCLETGEIAYEIELNDVDIRDSKKVKDVPFRDPSENPRIKSEYSVERLLQEISQANQYEEAKEAALAELELVKKEINEWIAAGPDSLLNAGLTQREAREIIEKRYTEGDSVRMGLIKALRKGGLVEESKELAALVNKLKKVLGLASYRK